MSFDGDTKGRQIIEAFKDEAKDKTVVITGPSQNSVSGEAAVQLASASPALIILVGRDEANIQPIIEQIREENTSVQAEFVKADLTSNSAVRRAAARIVAKVKKVDILINSAGVMAIKPYAKTGDEIETHPAADHIGHFVLTELLLEKLASAGNARVINLTSTGSEMAQVNVDDPNFEPPKVRDPCISYDECKIANILHARAITTKYKGRGITACAVASGLIPKSGLQSNCSDDVQPFMHEYKHKVLRNDGEDLPPQTSRTLQQACATVLLAALDPSLIDDMPAFMLECKAVPVNECTTSARNIDSLWSLSQNLVKD